MWLSVVVELSAAPRPAPCGCWYIPTATPRRDRSSLFRTSLERILNRFQAGEDAVDPWVVGEKKPPVALDPLPNLGNEVAALGRGGVPLGEPGQAFEDIHDGERGRTFGIRIELERPFDVVFARAAELRHGERAVEVRVDAHLGRRVPVLGNAAHQLLRPRPVAAKDPHQAADKVDHLAAVRRELWQAHDPLHAARRHDRRVAVLLDTRDVVTDRPDRLARFGGVVELERVVAGVVADHGWRDDDRLERDAPPRYIAPELDLARARARSDHPFLLALPAKVGEVAI